MDSIPFGFVGLLVYECAMRTLQQCAVYAYFKNAR